MPPIPIHPCFGRRDQGTASQMERLYMNLYALETKILVKRPTQASVRGKQQIVYRITVDFGRKYADSRPERRNFGGKKFDKRPNAIRGGAPNSESIYMKRLLILMVLKALFLAACSSTVSRNNSSIEIETMPVSAVSRNGEPRILAMGDSLMAWHNLIGKSIAHSVGRELQEPVSNHAVGGARIIYKLPISGAMGMKIANQYRKGNWDWIILNGGGNDLWFGCGCGRCERKMNKIISFNGRKGAIPNMMNSLFKTGARIVYVGYPRSPGVWSPIEQCRNEGAELEARISKLADTQPDLFFVSVADMVPHGDRSYHGVDMIHPSIKASAEIGERIAAVIREYER
ncbi:SGNH/GDSL hydrolase family protein [Pseudopelagicola sp. nBUS_19]|uniref:SGNH/GDSL hydrolase family protein n=1 Tax=Pseudopelagicola sp. nBUS_19 TaxID=3395316 RepID=UPI003EBDD92E